MLRLLFVCLLLATFAPARAGLIPEPRTYRPLDMFGNGYKHSVQKDGTWRIIANSRPYDGPGFGPDMALHRAAELTVEAGHTYFQIIDSNATRGVGLHVRDAERVKLIVRPVAGPDVPLECRAEQAQNCGTFEAAEVIARIGPTLKRK